jgi:hypothetical protein
MVLASLLLAACGDSDDSDMVARHELKVQAQAWENLSPTVSMDGMPSPSCTPLDVYFTITAGSNGFPEALKPEYVSLSRSGVQVWRQPVSAAETPGSKSEHSLSGGAGGCAPLNLAPGETLQLTVHVAAGYEEADISTSVTLATVE